ncbi:MBL fold metallo-hydrolase [Candidatus Kaiserbacteria bacterium]|nr:MBL fold metallo-hydrolase [Candidatus Kaiserbacteria bacterium]USN92467.1 MAG: MBL fold metallo-hydrolase [Candidatus Nomurabacteria bacterium]
MSDRFLLVRSIILTLLLVVSVVVWFPFVSLSQADESQLLTVRFLDVGQGDSIHIITPDGYEMLIDGGPGGSVLRELANGRSFFDRSIDIVVATHPDTDHIGGLVDVIEKYQIGAIMETEVEGDSQAVIAFDKVVRAEGAHVVSAKAGQIIELGASTTVKILSPKGDTTNWENNTASIVLQLQYGEVGFMLTGDAPIGIENYLVDIYGEQLESEVLKLGHHGSETSSDSKFLKVVEPLYAVVSAGNNNRYGHPKESVLARAKATGAEVLSTAERGAIIFKSDGKEVWVE